MKLRFSISGLMRDNKRVFLGLGDQKGNVSVVDKLCSKIQGAHRILSSSDVAGTRLQGLRTVYLGRESHYLDTFYCTSIIQITYNVFIYAMNIFLEKSARWLRQLPDNELMDSCVQLLKTYGNTEKSETNNRRIGKL